MNETLLQMESTATSGTSTTTETLPAALSPPSYIVPMEFDAQGTLQLLEKFLGT